MMSKLLTIINKVAEITGKTNVNSNNKEKYSVNTRTGRKEEKYGHKLL